MSSTEGEADPTPPPAADLFAAVRGVHDLLAPLAADQRVRVVRSAFELLGGPLPPGPGAGAGGRGLGGAAADDGGEDRPAAARQWMTRHGLTDDSLTRYFHGHGERTAVIDMPKPSKVKKEQVVNAYLLRGVAALLTTGTPAFTDDQARELCRQLGCFDSTNHSKAYKDFGNRLIGSPGDGWRLTNPGLQAAADLLRSAPG